MYAWGFLLQHVSVRMFASVVKDFERGEHRLYLVCCLDVRGSGESRVKSRSNVCVCVCVCVCVLCVCVCVFMCV